MYSQAELHVHYECEVLHLRYANEHMSRMSHFIQQVEEVFLDDLYDRGLSLSKYEVHFSSMLAHRIDSYFHETTPSIVFLEMKSLNIAEWSLLSYIYQQYDVPIVALIPSELDNETIMLRLCRTGVREVFTKIDSSTFQGIVERNKKNHD